MGKFQESLKVVFGMEIPYARRLPPVHEVKFDVFMSAFKSGEMVFLWEFTTLFFEYLVYHMK